MRSISLRTLAFATVAVLAAGYALAFFYAPRDADQGFIQKIFYLHVPLAIVRAASGFIVAAVLAIRHLRTGDRDLGRPLLRLDPHLGDLRRRRAARPARSGPRAPGGSGGSGASRRWSAS